VVETNAVFSCDDVRPVCAGSLPENIYKLIKPHAENQTTILNAALNSDRDALYKAFENDPLIKERVNSAEIRALADEMLKGTAKYLPDGWGFPKQ